MRFKELFTRRSHQRVHVKTPLDRTLRNRGGDTFLVESFFLRELIQSLTPTPDEHMSFLTGPKVRSIRVICRCAAQVPMEQQSVVFVRTSAINVADALIPIIEQGSELAAVAHSHPGCGPSATNPSGIDKTCLGKLQRAGSPAIGLIVTRDGHARFFTVAKRFRVLVVGSGVTKIDENLFHLEKYEDNQYDSFPADRSKIQHYPSPRTDPWI
jgi:hypothetical protein